MYHNRCIVCDNQLIEILTIDSLFSSLPMICDVCENNIVQINVCKRCENCKKKLDIDENKCIDCMFIQSQFSFTNELDFVSDYHAQLSALLHQYKSSGDILLAKVLAHLTLKHYSKKYFKQFDYIIPMPISDKRLALRGFNHITTILDYMAIKYHNVLQTDYREKQMHLTKKERLSQTNPFRLINACDIKDNARILLFDDIYTTGLTMSHAKSVLLSNKHCEIKMLAFARA